MTVTQPVWTTKHKLQIVVESFGAFIISAVNESESIFNTSPPVNGGRREKKKWTRLWAMDAHPRHSIGTYVLKSKGGHLLS